MDLIHRIFTTAWQSAILAAAMTGFIKLNMIVEAAWKARKARQAKAIPVSSAR